MVTKHEQRVSRKIHFHISQQSGCYCYIYRMLTLFNYSIAEIPMEAGVWPKCTNEMSVSMLVACENVRNEMHGFRTSERELWRKYYYERKVISSAAYSFVLFYFSNRNRPWICAGVNTLPNQTVIFCP